MPDGTRRRIIRQTVIIEEGSNTNIKNAPKTVCPVKIVSVSWGVKDYTEAARTKYTNGQKGFKATNTEWGSDGWPGYTKSLVIVYEVCGNYSTAVARENGFITLP